MLGDNRTLVERVKRTSARWSPLKKVDTLGELDFCTGVVMFNKLESRCVAGITLANLASQQEIDVVEFQRLSSVLPLVVHEYTHFLDTTSTVWGLAHLKMLNDAYSCEMRDESEFYVMRKCYNHMRRLRLPEYYTVVAKERVATHSWQWDLTAGREFNHDGRPGDRQILFSSFSNALGEFLVRSPISALSLLETNAMAEEVEATSLLIGRIADEGARKVQESIYEDVTLKHLHDVNLTEYSVCAHMVAIIFEVKDVRTAFWASSILARLALNSSRKVYERINENLVQSLAHTGICLENDQADVLRKALSDCNPGAIFYIFCLQIRRGALADRSSFVQYLMVAIHELGMSLEFFKDTALEEASEHRSSLRKSTLNTILDFSKAGFENLERLLLAFGSLSLKDLNLPPVLLSDSESYQFNDVSHNYLRVFDIEKSYSEMAEGQIKMEAFGDACM